MSARSVSLLILAALFAVAFLGSGRAHGPAQWIMDGGYKAKSGSSCCDVSDCKVRRPGQFRKVAEGIWFKPDEAAGEFLIPWSDRNRGLYTSETADWWACFRKVPGTDTWELRCVFVPPGRGV